MNKKQIINIFNKKKTFPVVTYNKTFEDKSKINNDNKGKSGIYCFNKVTGNSYVGSSISLSRRFINYYSLSCFEKNISKGSSAIHRALLKYGYSIFSLDILEYCDINVLIEREQYYIDLKPKYNILKKASRF